MIHRDATAQTTMAPKTAQAASFALRCACACCRAFVLSPALSLVAFAAVAGITAADIFHSLIPQESGISARGQKDGIFKG